MKNKYNTGDEVFIIKEAFDSLCTECDGAGEVKYKTYDACCPVCNGRGRISNLSVERDIIIYDMSPTYIFKDFTFMEHGKEHLNEAFNKKPIFATEKECLKAIEKRNKGKANKKRVKNKFFIDDKVFVIKESVKFFDCIECNGTGEVKYKNSNVICPICKGKGIRYNGLLPESEPAYNFQEESISGVLFRAHTIEYLFSRNRSSTSTGEKFIFSTEKECLEEIIRKHKKGENK